jgi:hypothetical protein
MQNIFSNEHNESPVTILRQTMSVSLDDDGTPVVSFAVNRGKGSGSQTIPIAEFADYIAALEEVRDAGIPEVSEEELSAAEMVRKTIKAEGGVISFRVKGGKGAKPAKVGSEDFSEVVELLRSTLDAVEDAAKQLAE